ncbi:ATP-binding protein [Wukongibacter baidiensis]|uniref:two-component system sensor histidine kinase NtrB n=1 Tax=Wukongibacter baidiensis TaxID=1723361 RepID=UPI003D7F77D3
MRNKKKLHNIIFIILSTIIITILHYFTTANRWDIHEFLRRLYYIPIIVSAFRFRLKGGLLSSIIISLLYAPHLLLPYVASLSNGDITILNQFLEIIMFIAIGTATGFLVEADYKKKKMLEQQIKKLTDLENYTQNILDSMTNVLIAVNKHLEIQSINKEGRKLFQLKGSFIGTGLENLFLEHERLEKILLDMLSRNKKILNKELRFTLKTGQEIYVKLIAYPLYNILDEIEGVVIVLEDISKIRKLESQIRRAEKLSAVGELASGIAHEIRNPLGIIKTISQTINNEIQDEEIKEGIEIIIHEVNRANTVIKGMLDFAKPHVHQKKYHSLNKLISEVLLITDKYTQQHHVEVNYCTKDDKNLLVDVDKLKQAFINIIFNAVQAMPEGGSLDINLLVNNGYTKISFKDTGQGISQDIVEKIFEPFYTTKDTGTGLGLAITHRIIEEHNGYIEVDSKLGEGTRINIYLPMEVKGVKDD